MTTAHCLLCHQEVDTSRVEGWEGRHRYGCLKIGRIQLEGILDNGYYGQHRCGHCGARPVIARRTTSGGMDFYYCERCAAHPLRKMSGEPNPFGIFVSACYRGKR